MKHKFYDVIVAYSLGHDIQCKIKKSTEWKSVTPFPLKESDALNTFPNFNDTELDFRIKSEIKTGEYRTALLKFACGTTLVVAEDREFLFDSNENFVKYLSDWIPYEYED